MLKERGEHFRSTAGHFALPLCSSLRRTAQILATSVLTRTTQKEALLTTKVSLNEAKMCATAKYSSPSATFAFRVVTSSTAFSFFSAYRER